MTKTKNDKGKFYYANVLCNQNKPAKPNVVWAMDFTEIKTQDNKTVTIFICIDIFTNKILSFLIRKEKITSAEIVRSLKAILDQRVYVPSEPRLIIHSDRGSQFTSKTYNAFVNEKAHLFQASMSKANSPKDNSVCERMIRTLKECRIDGKTFEESLSNKETFDHLRSSLAKYVIFLNNKPNKKSPLGPNKNDLQSNIAQSLMKPPKYEKSFSERYFDPRLEEVNKYKQESDQTYNIIDTYLQLSDNPQGLEYLNLKVNFLAQICKDLILQKEDIQNVANEVRDDLSIQINTGFSEIKQEIQSLKRKKQVNSNTLKLRDPIYSDNFQVFMRNAGLGFKRMYKIKSAQLRIFYILSYYLGTRINELVSITHQDIKDAITYQKISLVHTKTKLPMVHILTQEAVNCLKNNQESIDFLFIKSKYAFLGGKNRIMHKKSTLRLVNNDLRQTCATFGINLNIKSHSFRAGLITSLLKTTTLVETAQIVGHKCVLSTMRYNRYALDEEQIRSVLTKAFSNQ